ncbi:hypothetical protein [Phocaeicola plebeius]|jgi:hypothetical protein|uniref:hypothetical protein n=1 Tax=Phocaeicola plebeius TaxID=310297 RepID=UPI001EF6A4C7|nr:hypothetical protein [Phocaeicola plebeius]DAL66986.1 MAG TPA: syndecan-2 protein [Caudoviricetes sp.]
MKLYDYIMGKVSRCITLAPFMCIILLASAIWSCRSIKYVPVESIQYDSVYLNKVVKDSIYIKDSVLLVKGDTIIEYRYKYIYQYKDKTDTLYVTKTDSVQVPYPVEKQLTWWQQFQIDVGGWAIGIAIISAIIVIMVVVRKMKK